MPPPPPPPPPQILLLLATVTGTCARNAAPPALPGEAGAPNRQLLPAPPAPPAPAMVPLLMIVSVLPAGKSPVSNAATPVDVELMMTLPAIVTIQVPGVSVLAWPLATR